MIFRRSYTRREGADDAEETAHFRSGHRGCHAGILAFPVRLERFDRRAGGGEALEREPGRRARRGALDHGSDGSRRAVARRRHRGEARGLRRRGRPSTRASMRTRRAGASEIEIARADLAAAVLDTVRPDVELLFGDTVTALAQDADRRRRVL